MSTLEKFLNDDASELLRTDDLVLLSGGNEGVLDRDINALANCSAPNNCHSGNCVVQCGGGCTIEDPSTQLT